MKNEKLPDSDVVEAAGGLLWRGEHDHLQIAIIHRPRYDDWTLPKGKREPGESWVDTARREVFEETGCSFSLGEFAGGIVYKALGVPKVVLYWHMYLLEEVGFTPSEEVDQVTWLTPTEALRIMSYPDEAGLVEKIEFETHTNT